jgi:hypothetical protein
MNNFDLLINDELSIMGLVSFQVKYDKSTNKYITEGILKTHVYIEDIKSIECNRFRLEGVNVYLESFGSTDVFNLYYFNYTSYIIYDIDLMEHMTKEELIELYKKELEEN